MQYSQRGLVILFLLLKEKTYITSATFAEILNVSTRTVKRDIKLMLKPIYSLGFKIISKKGFGYKINITDEERCSYFCSRLFEQYSHVNEIIDEESIMMLDWAIKYLLTLNEPIDTITLAHKLYINERALRNLMPQIKKELSHYHLNLIEQKKGVLSLMGEELHKRVAMLDYFTFFMTDNLESSKFPLFDKWFEIKPQLLEKLQNAIINSIINANKKIENYKIQKLAYIFILSLNRHLDGNEISIDKNILKEYDFSSQLLLVNKIIAELPIHTFDLLPPDEILFLSIIVFVYQDFYNSFNEVKYSFFYNQSYNYRNILMDLLKNKYELSFSSHERFITNITVFLFPFYIKQKLFLVDNNRWRNYSRAYLKSFDQVSIDLAYQCALKLKETSNYMLCKDDIIQLAIIFHNSYSEKTSEKYDFLLNVAIIANNNFRMVYYVEEYLKICKYSDYIKNITLFHAYELVDVSLLEEYDLILSEKNNQIDEKSTKGRSNYYTLPDLTERERYFVIERYLSDIIHFDMFKNSFPNNIMVSIQKITNSLNKNDIFKFIAKNFYENNLEKYNELLNYFKKRESLTSYETENNISIINTFSTTHESKITIYILENIIRWDKNNIKYIVQFNISNMKYISFLEFITRFYRKCVYHENYLTEFINKGDRHIFKNDILDLLR